MRLHPFRPAGQWFVLSKPAGLRPDTSRRPWHNATQQPARGYTLSASPALPVKPRSSCQLIYHVQLPIEPDRLMVVEAVDREPATSNRVRRTACPPAGRRTSPGIPS